MSDFFFARSLMAMSLAFHIVFAALGIGMVRLARKYLISLLASVRNALSFCGKLYPWDAFKFNPSSLGNVLGDTFFVILT